MYACEFQALFLTLAHILLGCVSLSVTSVKRCGSKHQISSVMTGVTAFSCRPSLTNLERKERKRIAISIIVSRFGTKDNMAYYESCLSSSRVLRRNKKKPGPRDGVPAILALQVGFTTGGAANYPCLDCPGIRLIEVWKNQTFRCGPEGAGVDQGPLHLITLR
jgi:hypothetical protein